MQAPGESVTISISMTKAFKLCSEPSGFRTTKTIVLIALVTLLPFVACSTISKLTPRAAASSTTGAATQPAAEAEPSNAVVSETIASSITSSDTSGFVRLPAPVPGFWVTMMTPEIAYEYRAINYVSQCTRFVADMLIEYFGDEVYVLVFPDGVKDANETFLDWKENPHLVRLPPSKLAISEIQDLSDGGYLVLMAYYYPDISGHVAFVGHSDLKLFTIPAINNLEGKRGSKMQPSYFPVMVQAGTYTGVTSMVYATNGWLRNDNFGSGVVRYYVVKAE